MELHNNLVFTLIIKILLLEISKSNVLHPKIYIFKNIKYKKYANIADLSSTSCATNVSRRIYPNIENSSLHNPGTPSVIYNFTNYKVEHIKGIVCCDGYVKIGQKCIPHCSPPCGKGGICVKPNMCVCNKGYRMSNDTNDKESCVPVCTQGCINGTCVEPDVCKCNKDYWLDSNGFTCCPLCSDECEQNHGYCPEPNVCSCLPGYEKTGNGNSSSFTCKPVCSPACINSYCIAPNVCRCISGYERDEFDSRFICKPKCEDACVHGTCTYPKICTCLNGYRKVNATVCEPICSEPCVNGICAAPETCNCFEGYELRKNSRYICEPVCKMNCGNGTCTAPGVCTCDESFIYNNQTDPVCQSNCEVQCDRLTYKSNIKTLDVCEFHNLHSNCTCVQGYRFSAIANKVMKTYTNIFQNKLTFGIPDVKNPFAANAEDDDVQKHFFEPLCQPICDFGCIYGTCIAPNVCNCYAGFRGFLINNNKERICVHRSRNILTCNATKCGSDEVCNKLNFCTCKDGYKKNAHGRCVPVCTPACVHSLCTTQDRCICNAGYELRDKHFCEPICEQGCKNGDCIDPNHCVCHDNFVRNTGHRFADECISACTRNCSGHGVCVIDDEYNCKCHFGWTGSDCDQPTMCAISVNLNHTDINRITIRNDTNSTIVQAYKNAPHCNNSLNNESLCYLLSVVHSDEDHMTPTVGCLLDLSHMTSRHSTVYNTTNNVVTVWLLIVVAVLILTAATTYLIYRRHRKNKLTANISLSPVKMYIASETLLSENADYF